MRNRALTQTPQPTTAPTEPFLTRAPGLYFRGADRGVIATLTLEDIRDDLRAIHHGQSKRDRLYDMDTLAVGFPGGRAVVQRVIAGGKRSEPVGFTRHSWNQFTSALVRSPANKPIAGAGKVLEDMARRGTRGEQLATLAASSYARWQGDRTHLFRTAVIDGKRTVRSVQGPRYAPYDHHEMVQDVMGALGNAHVLSCTVHDRAMVLRITDTPAHEIGLDNPISMYQIGNSEVGCRAAWIEGGLWKLVCTNGMGSWQDKRSYRWRHSGDPQRIRDGIVDAVAAIDAESSGLLHAYDKALGTMIGDAMAWMEAELAGDLPADTISRVAEGMQDATSSPMGTLAGVVDGITLIAQDDGFDALEQWDLERTAGRLMQRGLRQADRHGGRIPAALA